MGRQSGWDERSGQSGWDSRQGGVAAAPRPDFNGAPILSAPPGLGDRDYRDVRDVRDVRDNRDVRDVRDSLQGRDIRRDNGGRGRDYDRRDYRDMDRDRDSYRDSYRDRRDDRGYDRRDDRDTRFDRERYSRREDSAEREWAMNKPTQPAKPSSTAWTAAAAIPVAPPKPPAVPNQVIVQASHAAMHKAIRFLVACQMSKYLPHKGLFCSVTYREAKGGLFALFRLKNDACHHPSPEP